MGVKHQTGLHAVWLAARDLRTPMLAKVLALTVAAYTV
jgi:uncharacterized membrane protein YkvA (DUF1232 family)